MSRYTIDTQKFIAILRANIRRGIQHCPELDRRLLFDVDKIPLGLLNETVVRLLWNDLNILSRFPHDKWDDGAAIGKWFDGYDIDRILLSDDGEEIIADEDSEKLFEFSIDPTICFIHETSYSCGIKQDWQWEEHVLVEVRSTCVIMENLGDFRIRDWERMKEMYEGNEQRNENDIYRLYSPRTH